MVAAEGVLNQSIFGAFHISSLIFGVQVTEHPDTRLLGVRKTGYYSTKSVDLNCKLEQLF